MMKVLGGCMDPHAAFLALRGLKTLHLRVERQCENALALARRFEGHPKVRARALPGPALASRPRDRARARCRPSAGIVTLVLAGGLAAAERFYDRLRSWPAPPAWAASSRWSACPSTPRTTATRSEQLRAAGIDPGMVRVSMGVEDAADLMADVEQALAG